MPPNTNAAITGFALIFSEAGAIYQLLLSNGLTDLVQLVVPAFLLYGLIGWFYTMHLFGLYENNTQGEL